MLEWFLGHILRILMLYGNIIISKPDFRFQYSDIFIQNGNAIIFKIPNQLATRLSCGYTFMLIYYTLDFTSQSRNGFLFCAWFKDCLLPTRPKQYRTLNKLYFRQNTSIAHFYKCCGLSLRTFVILQNIHSLQLMYLKIIIECYWKLVFLSQQFT